MTLAMYYLGVIPINNYINLPANKRVLVASLSITTIIEEQSIYRRKEN